MKKFHIEPLSRKLEADLRSKIDFKTKPIGALGQLEKIALQVGLVQNTVYPLLKNPHIVIFAGDHGITREHVSAYPQEVTFQMVMNFLNGGAAINVFCKQHSINIKVVDAGVNYKFPKGYSVIDSKIGMGTRSFLNGAAMSMQEAEACIDKGSEIVEKIFEEGCNVIGFGEMGIGNTTSASALMHIFTGIEIQECVGKGTGIDMEKLMHKFDVIKNAVRNNRNHESPLEKLATFGGFEIVQMVGAMLKAAELKMIVLVDGFIATSAFLAANTIDKNIFEYTVFCHQSEERGHVKMLEYLKVKPLISLDMRLGEGTGCAVAYPIIQSAVNFLNEMSSFESAGVSNKKENELA